MCLCSLLQPTRSECKRKICELLGFLGEYLRTPRVSGFHKVHIPHNINMYIILHNSRRFWKIENTFFLFTVVSVHRRGDSNYSLYYILYLPLSCLSLLRAVLVVDIAVVLEIK